MAESNYKWRLVLSLNQGELSYYLHDLPSSKEVDSSYTHKPGDINYADVKFLPSKIKQKILYYIATEHVKELSPEEDVAIAIAGMIFIDRLTNPNFVPEELNPDNWKPVLFTTEE